MKGSKLQSQKQRFLCWNRPMWGNPDSAIYENFSRGIQNPGKILLVESGILGFGIRYKAQGIPNPTRDWNSKSKFHWQRLESITWTSESTAYNAESKTIYLEFPYMGRSKASRWCSVFCITCSQIVTGYTYILILRFYWSKRSNWWKRPLNLVQRQVHKNISQRSVLRAFNLWYIV